MVVLALKILFPSLMVAHTHILMVIMAEQIFLRSARFTGQAEQRSRQSVRKRDESRGGFVK